ncbi:pre-mRNA-processing factor 17 [Takifugu rubripes]|uniref:Pre-mRNA-processing factor 17 n=1 Tax=Takifugu rubripes TaxID=31033 RepID=A0A674P5I1_TAKRU|nr:pre-mRNA-processing factor 17 [Takifugu rubripes]|eukprot:XP_003971799.1 PREDICTED: pre-mRNA-processing factor 17 [Takifugu rubripes]
MSAAISSLVSYGSDSDPENDSESNKSTEKEDQTHPDATAHLQPLESGHTMSLALLNAAPEVPVKEAVMTGSYLDPSLKEVAFNPTFETMFSPEFGPTNPFNNQQMAAARNMLSGYAEPAHLNDFMFEQQRRTFSTFGYALDPSVDSNQISSSSFIGAVDEAEKNKGLTVFDSGHKKPDKRKKIKGGDAEEIDNFLGPWAKYVDEKSVAKPTEEEKKELDEITAKRQKRGKIQDEAPGEEKTILHIKDMYDYQGRSYLHIPQDVGVSLRSSDAPDKCYLPKKQLHVWSGHTKGVSGIRLFPKSGHLLLSCSMDCKIKLWEVYKERRCIRTFIGHSKAVRDICFNNTGSQFLSAAYDRYLKLWDSETGKCISHFTNRKVPYCVKFNPDEDKQNLFVAGMSDKKIVQWDVRTGEVVQEYDRHLGAVNTITFVDENRRFVSTSDDKSLRVWEWDIPVDFKYIAEPSMHSMPAVTLSPNSKWLACQSMDNQILIFGAQNRFRLNKKKIFKGHMVAGYACQVDFSPDMSYVVSGDADGKLNIWDWKTTKLYHRIKAHDKVCISALWHPHETSKVITCGWDGQIKLWD